jgi:hypothetical protein
MDPDEYADAKREAKEEDYYEELDAHGWTCENPQCGEMWLPGYVRATRTDPGYVRQDSCPRCGSDPVRDVDGYPLVGGFDPDE